MKRNNGVLDGHSDFAGLFIYFFWFCFVWLLLCLFIFLFCFHDYGSCMAKMSLKGFKNPCCRLPAVSHLYGNNNPFDPPSLLGFDHFGSRCYFFLFSYFSGDKMTSVHRVRQKALPPCKVSNPRLCAPSSIGNRRSTNCVSLSSNFNNVKNDYALIFIFF